jgi:NADH-quinone oxidoreductase subunit L
VTLLKQAWLFPAVPAVSFFVILFFGKRLPKKGSEVGIGVLTALWILAIAFAVQWIRLPHEELREAVDRHVTWWQSGAVKIQAGLHVDGLTVMMLVVVSTISLLVHIYSTSYMEGDRRYTYFYAALSLFTASMMLLVIADNTLQLMVGWELVGLCSFMLIGHWWEEEANSRAALKAFFTTRTGDVGLMIGIITLFFAAGQNFNIAHLNEAALSGKISHHLLLVGGVCLFIGVMGKSAQFPLHTWLPDAMAGPTPVSALIHAATMVVAGVYLVARTYGVFVRAFSIAMPGHGPVNLVSLIGAITLVMAAALAFVQDDIKKVLAYSTISQLGYMIMALGVGAWTAGIFHLFTHAFFKALLFLGAGSVSHAVHSFDMKKDMGGMRKQMPVTFWTFVIGSLALAGVFPLAGFWSKDEILLGATRNGYNLMFYAGMVGAFMTAAYMTRCVYLTFFGEFRGHGHPHESPLAIKGPLVFLAILSVCAGWLAFEPGLGVHAFAHWTETAYIEQAHLPEHAFSYGYAGLSLAAALLGIALVSLFYWRHAFGFLHELSERNAAARVGKNVLVNRYYLDHLYTGVIVGGISGPVSRIAYWINQNVIDGVVNGVGVGARKTGDFVYNVVDQKIVDGVVNGVGFSAEESGAGLRIFQTGRVQQYAAILFGAVAIFALVLVLAI